MRSALMHRPRGPWLLPAIVLLIALPACTSGSEDGAVTTVSLEEEDPAGTSEPTGTTEAPDVSEPQPVFEPIRVDLPRVPPIALPDLSLLDETGSDVEEQLGELLAPSNGLDVVSAECSAAGGELTYQGGEAGRSFFDLDDDGSGSVGSLEDGVSTLEVSPDGSGLFKRVGDGMLTIEVEADGTGRYSDVGGADGSAVTIEVEEDGFGSYKQTGTGTLSIELESDGAGSLKDTRGESVVTVTVEADGTGSYRRTGDGATISIAKESDGSLEFSSVGGGEPTTTLIVNPDGSGELRIVGEGIVTIEVDRDGSGTYSDSGGSIDESFQSDIGILDPKYVIAGPIPVFAIADRFPPLDTLAPLAPPCVTIIRLDSEVLFDFDSDQLRATADSILDEVALVVIESGRSIEIHGHTDSIGSDEYNADLSNRRATSVEAALRSRAVSDIANVEGFGESRPVAANERADGSDNPVGRQLNRRVEIVILPG